MLIRSIGAVLLGALLLTASQPFDAAANNDPLVTAQAQGTRDGELEPRYQPRTPEPEPAYDTSYIFAMTRGVSDTAIHPAGKVPLYFFTIPLDLALLPVALIGGLF